MLLSQSKSPLTQLLMSIRARLAIVIIEVVPRVLLFFFYDYYDDTSYGLYSSYISGPTAEPSSLFQVTGTNRNDWPSGPNPAGNEFHEITNTLLEKEATVAWRGSSDGNLYVKTIFVNTDGNVDSHNA